MQNLINYLVLPLSLLGIIAIESLGLQLILGGAGLLTLGHTAFFAIGGYASASFAVFLAPQLGLTSSALILFFGILLAGFFAALSAVLVITPCLRLKGD